MQEKEQIASQEAEKRLKAALAAKRDPSTANSRIASPSIGESGMVVEMPSEPKPETKSSEDVVMDNGNGSTSTSSPKPEVNTIYLTSNVRFIANFPTEPMGSRDEGAIR